MPIHINLLAEQQAEAEMRRRDPVKRAVLVAVLLVGLMGLWAGWLAFLGRNATTELAAIEEAIKTRDKDSKAALDDLKSIADAKSRLHALDTLATNRFLWAPVLDALQNAVVENIQLTQLKVEQGYLVKDAEPASKDKKTPAKPASSTERIVLRLQARDYGRDQDQTYIKFKDRLLTQPFFKQRLKEEQASFSGITAPTTDDEDPAKSYFTFTLECAFPEVKRP